MTRDPKVEILDAEETTSSDNNEQQDRREARRERTEKALEDVVSLGRLWATHGLTMGKLALRTSAKSLEVTASALGALAESLADEDEEADRAAEAD